MDDVCQYLTSTKSIITMEKRGCDIRTSGLNLPQKQSCILTMPTGARDIPVLRSHIPTVYQMLHRVNRLSSIVLPFDLKIFGRVFLGSDDARSRFLWNEFLNSILHAAVNNEVSIFMFFIRSSFHIFFPFRGLFSIILSFLSFLSISPRP